MSEWLQYPTPRADAEEPEGLETAFEGVEPDAGADPDLDPYLESEPDVEAPLDAEPPA